MKRRLTFAALAIASLCATAYAIRQSGTPIQPVFSDAERQDVLDFWKPADRYLVSQASPSGGQGAYAVRLTTAGSTWMWNVNHLKSTAKTSPNLDAPAALVGTPWDTWIAAKVAWDRHQAQNAADQANGTVTAPDPKLPPATDPGPCPQDLVTAAGQPPAFAEACVPTTYSVRFDDETLTYSDHIKVRPRYAYYRFAQGVDSAGTPVGTIPPDRIDHLYRMAKVDASAENVMRTVSSLEGGFDSVNTYDTGFVSAGFIQFASLKTGAGALGGLLLHYKLDDPRDFARDFSRYGVDVTPDGVLAVLDPVTGVEYQGPDANQKVIDDKRLIAVFARAGQKSDAYMAEQIATAKAWFYPCDELVTLKLGGVATSLRVSDFIRSEAGLATLMDRKVNTGKIDPLAAVAQRVADAHSVMVPADLVQYEAEIVQQLKFRRDFLADTELSQPGGLIGLPNRRGTRKSR
jgi:hypothetical protein